MRQSRLPYCPPAEGDPARVLHLFEQHARNEVSAFGKELDYDGMAWEVSRFVRTRSARPTKGGHLSLIFCKRRQHRWSPEVPLGPAVGGLARAFLRTKQGYSIATLEQDLAAFRLIDEAMEGLGVDEVGGINLGVLSRAMDVACREYAAVTSGNLGRALASIGLFLTRNGMVQAPLDRWRPPRTAPDPRLDRCTPEFAAHAAACRPSDEYMKTLAVAYGSAEKPAHVLVTSVAGLLCCAPERLNEAMALSEDCEVWRAGPDGRRTLGIRFRGSKGATDAVKWVGTAATPLAAECIARIREQTNEGRAIKRHYDANPEDIYLGAHEFLRRRETLDMEEVAVLLGLPSADQANRYVRRHKLRVDATPDSCGSPCRFLPFGVLQRHVLAQLPRRAADAGGAEAKNPLFVVPYKTFQRSEGWGPVPTMYESVSHMQISRGLGKSCEAYPTMFQRMGLDPERLLTAGSHAFRHFLSDLALRGGMSEEDLAVWSSRRFVLSNRNYDHISGQDIRAVAARVDLAGAILGGSKLLGAR